MLKHGILRIGWMALLVASITIYAHFFSLFHAFSGDQLGFVASMSQRTQWSDTLLGNLDYTRTKTRGDILCFRPLLYFFLTNEYFWFGNFFLGWQLVGLFLHLCVTLLLFSFILRVRHSVFLAFLAASFFGVLLVSSQAVSWQHIHAYVLFGLLLLGSLHACLSFLRKDGLWTLSALFFLLLAMVFLYEAGTLICLTLGFFLVITEKDKHRRLLASLSVFIPLLIYLAVWTARYFLFIRNFSSEEQLILTQVVSIKTLKNALAAMTWWIKSGLVPSELLSTYQMSLMRLGYASENTGWPSLLAIGALLGLSAACFKSPKGLFRSRESLFSIVLFLCAFGTALLISAGRFNTRGTDGYLGFNSYYAYLFWLMVIPAACLALSRNSNEKGLGFRVSRDLAVVGLISSIAANAYGTAAVNKDLASAFQTKRQVVSRLEDFVRNHGDEPGFSFALKDAPGDELLPWLKGRSDRQSFSYYQALYSRYYNRTNPKYLITFSPPLRSAETTS